MRPASPSTYKFRIGRAGYSNAAGNVKDSHPPDLGYPLT